MYTKRNVLSDFLDSIKDDSVSYPELRNYNAYKKLLEDKILRGIDSSLSALVEQLIEKQPNRNLVDMACTLAGAMNLLAYREIEGKKQTDKTNHKYENYEQLEETILEEARELFWDEDDSGKKLDRFVERYYKALFELSLSRTNCPTIPQRIFPLATFLPKSGSIGVVELGCSRGDLGIALLNSGRVLRPRTSKEKTSPYLFSKPTEREVERRPFVDGIDKTYRQFGEKSMKEIKSPNSSDIKLFPERSWREIMRTTRPIDRYFGVDLQGKEQTESDWLLALWGLRDQRRKTLARFYRDFKVEESIFFKRVVADALDVGKYLGDMLDFMSGVDNLVLFTSYMVYQLDISQRFLLVDVVRRIKSAFEIRFPGKRFYWFNQGSSVSNFFNERRLNFDSLCFSELKFNEADRLCGRDLAILLDGCNSNWRTPNILVLYGGPSRESLSSVKSANTVVSSLYEAGFSYSIVEIPQNVLEPTTCLDKKFKNDFQKELESKTKFDRADIRTKAILDTYEQNVKWKKNDSFDIVFPYIIGLYGEDGCVQKILEEKNLSYIGCDSISSQLGMDKNLSKKIWNAQAPSREYWTEQENNKTLTVFEWDQRIRRNPLWFYERIKIEYCKAKGDWYVVKDDSVDFSKASCEEKDSFAQRIFDSDSYDEITDDQWSERLKEMIEVTLRRWEYSVFIYEDIWNSDVEKLGFSFETSPKDGQRKRREEIIRFLKNNQEKRFVIERRYEAPVMTAPWIFIKKDDSIDCIYDKICSFNKNNYERLLAPCVLKPCNEGSSLNLILIDECSDSPDVTPEERLAKSVVDELKKLENDKHEDWILEKRLSGIDLTVTVIGVGDNVVALPPILIRPRGDIYDYDAKYTYEDTTYLFQISPISSEYLLTMKNVAIKAYRMLGCRDFARVDLLMVDDENDKGKKLFYVLEVNTIPGATMHSLTPKAAIKAGFSLPEFFRCVIDYAFYRYSSPYAMREILGQQRYEI